MVISASGGYQTRQRVSFVPLLDLSVSIQFTQEPWVGRNTSSIRLSPAHARAAGRRCEDELSRTTIGLPVRRTNYATHRSE
jgi:hypothetical protein